LIRVARFFAGLALAACAASVALAQDELPKDAPPAPKPETPALPSETPPDQSALPPGTMVDEPIVMLQALDKITARVKRMPVKVGQAATFGTLSVQVDACRKAPPEDPPESAAFLKISDGRFQPAKTIFSGWMFASSPALSAMDHPVYDIWVIDCTSDTTVAGSTSPAPGAAPSVPTLPAAPSVPSLPAPPAKR
jgi:hypothetical protein